MPQVFKSRPPSGAKRGKKRKLADAPLPPSPPPRPPSSLWVSKHAPHHVADLVVHRRKVADVRAWLESRLHDRKHHVPGGQCLLITGPPGAGKSATIALLAQELNIHFSEWTPPAPTPWNEHLHHAFTGQRYTSKLEEFEAFVEGARKFPVLPLGTSEKVKGVLVEDLPYVSGSAQTQQLCRALQQLARSAWFVTVVVVTEGAEEGRSGWREAVQAVEAAGATKIAFNPITPPAIKRLLTKIAATEKCRLSADHIAAIAEHSNGDLRHAISSLEFQSTKLHTSLPQKPPFESEKTRTNTTNNSRTSSSISSSSNDDTTSSPSYGRDTVFSHYHALGKFLHNKRHLDQPLESFQEMNERFLRHPLNMEVPEQILVDAQIEFPTLVAFLHENVLDFVDEEAIDDVAEVLTYLGDADIQLSGRHRQFSSSSSEDGVLGVRAAGSVAARGVLFGNAHPAPRKWQSVRAPVLWQVERVLAEKKGSTMPRSQLSCEAPPSSSPPDASADEPMDDIRSLTADCIVDLDVDEMVPHSSTPVQIQCVDRGPSNGVFEDHMEEDEDIIEEDED